MSDRVWYNSIQRDAFIERTCRLWQSTLAGIITTTAWIETRGAKVGAKVELLPSREIWTVDEVFTHGLPEHVLKHTQSLNRKSLPSVDPIS